MRVVQLTVTPDADGAVTRQSGYPPGWEKLYGAIEDETFAAPPDLLLTPVESLELPPTPQRDEPAS